MIVASKRTAAKGAVVIGAVGAVALANASWAGAWAVTGSASSTCSDTGTVLLKGALQNLEADASGDMNVTMSALSKSDGPKLVAHGQTGSFTIDTGLSSVPAGSVTFDETWANRSGPPDSKTASYNALSCGTPSPTQIPTPTFPLAPVCGVGNDLVTYPSSPDWWPSEATWNGTKVSMTFTMNPGVNHVFPNGKRTVTVTEDELDTTPCVTPPPVTTKPLCITFNGWPTGYTYRVHIDWTGDEFGDQGPFSSSQTITVATDRLVGITITVFDKNGKTVGTPSSLKTVPSSCVVLTAPPVVKPPVVKPPVVKPPVVKPPVVKPPVVKPPVVKPPVVKPPVVTSPQHVVLGSGAPHTGGEGATDPRNQLYGGLLFSGGLLAFGGAFGLRRRRNGA